MKKIIKRYIDGDYLVTEYGVDGVATNFTKEHVSSENQVIQEPIPTIEEQILAELQYNTALTEMKMLGGTV